MRVRDLRTGEILIDIDPNHWFLDTLQSAAVDSRYGFRLEVSDKERLLLESLLQDISSRDVKKSEF